MRKIVTALMGTLSGLVLLFSYHTSTAEQAVPGGASPESAAGSSQSSSESLNDGMPDPTEATSETEDSSADAMSGTFTGDAAETRYGARSRWRSPSRMGSSSRRRLSSIPTETTTTSGSTPTRSPS